MNLTRHDVSSIAACVQACNDGGVLDPLLDKLRALYVSIPAGGEIELPDAPRREPGAPDTVVVDPTAVDPIADTKSSAVDSSPAGRLSFRPETFDRIAREDHPAAAAEPEEQHRRRRRRTCAVGEP
jgi:hypothetical protein